MAKLALAPYPGADPGGGFPGPGGRGLPPRRRPRRRLQPPPAASRPTPAAGQADFTLHAFHIVGAKTETVKDLKKQLSIKLPSFWPPWGTPPPFRLQDLEYDVERLKNFYRRQGFYHTEIKPEINYGPGRAVDVTLKIDEGPWVKVTDIDVEVAGAMDLSELRSEMAPQPRGSFRRKALRRSQKSLP